MKTSIRLKLNKDRQLNCGMYPLVFQIIHRRQRRLIYTGIKVPQEAFSQEKQRVVSTNNHRFKKGVLGEMNEKLAAMRRSLESLLDHLAFTGQSFSAEDIAQLYHRKQQNKYVLTFTEYLINEKQEAGKFGTAKNYRYTLSALRSFVKSDLLRFEDIDYRFLKNYELFLQKRNLKPNSITFYLHNLRSIYNKAADEGIFELPPGGSPFNKVSAKIIKTIKRALPKEVIRQITQLNLTEYPDLDLSRDLFMFSFYTRGMSFVDVVNLKKTDIEANVIHYFRAKTKTYLKVTLTEQLQAILDKYRHNDSYVFPCLSGRNSKQRNYTRYRTLLAWHNRCLKKIAKMMNINTPLTTYVARHSWATTAKEKGISIAVISESLGHSSENITNIYLKAFEQDVIDEANWHVAQL